MSYCDRYVSVVRRQSVRPSVRLSLYLSSTISFIDISSETDKRKVKRSATITSRSPSLTQDEDETDKTKQGQIEQTYEKH